MTKTKRIHVSPQHGLNPSLDLCFVCGEAKGLLLFGRLKGDAEAPKQVVYSGEPCDSCMQWMQQGIILISARGESAASNPYRTGGWVVVTEEAFRRMFSGAAADAGIQKRVCFLSDEAWNQLGLPALTRAESAS